MLAIGTRVIIKLPTEPDELDAAKTYGRMGCGGWLYGHQSPDDNRSATIVECPIGGFPCKFGQAMGHGYVVRYDRGWTNSYLDFWGGHYAENELEVI